MDGELGVNEVGSADASDGIGAQGLLAAHRLIGKSPAGCVN